MWLHRARSLWTHARIASIRQYNDIQSICTASSIFSRDSHTLPTYKDLLDTATSSPSSSPPKTIPAFDNDPLTKHQNETPSLPALPDRTRYLLRSFRRSATLKERALTNHFINNELYTEASLAFSKFITTHLSLQDAQMLSQLSTADAHDMLFSHLFIDFLDHKYRQQLENYRALIQTLDLRHPHLWFSMARSLKRRVIYHSGPTNSGKTYEAVSRLRAAPSGMYCGPLRLLAMEIYDQCNREGTICNLVTGQEVRTIAGAAHVACTVEMVNMNRRVDVAVIDEIQMIGDRSRGWAWTRALLGVPAAEIHVCGDGSALDLVQWLCNETGETLEVKTYERFSALEVEERGLQGGYKKCKPGDCIVAFSRNDIYSIKKCVEVSTEHKACIVYGNLPPETRRHQARLFNDPNNDHNIMIASDAVGMGLNLAIRRVIFHTLTKKITGETGKLQRVPVNTSMVKQIAGRAGRRGTQYSQGRVTCLKASDVSLLKNDLNVPLESLATPRAGLYPEFEHFEAFAAQQTPFPHTTTFPQLLTAFSEKAILSPGGRYFMCRQEAILATSELLCGIQGLSLKDMYTFCMAPASVSDVNIAAALLYWAKRYAAGLPCELKVLLFDKSNVNHHHQSEDHNNNNNGDGFDHGRDEEDGTAGDAVDEIINTSMRPPHTSEEMKSLETAYQIVTLWIWLSYRFEDVSFPNRKRAIAIGNCMCDLLSQGLENITDIGKGDIEKTSEGAYSKLFDVFDEEYKELVTMRKEVGADGNRKVNANINTSNKKKKRSVVSKSGGDVMKKFEKKLSTISIRGVEKKKRKKMIAR